VKLTDMLIDVLKARCTKIHYFGLGFIQVKLGETSRMHFYTGELPALVPLEEIHNHRYNFRSVILRGVLKQTFFEAQYSWSGKATHVNVFESCKPPGQEELRGIQFREILERETECVVQETSSVILGSGSEYTIDHRTFHRVEPLGDCITYLDRGPVQKDFAEILRPIGAEKVCPFSKVVPEARLWEIVEQMLGSKS
jgi:hypothetical protein